MSKHIPCLPPLGTQIEQTKGEESPSRDTHRRGCFFNHERHLRLFKEYTETNCYIECIVNHTAKSCGCVPFHMPRWRAAKMCGPEKQPCRKQAELTFLRESYLEMEGKNLCRCKPACSSITYDVDTESAPGENLAEVYRMLDVADFQKYARRSAKEIP